MNVVPMNAESFGVESDRDDTEYLEAMQGIITNFEDSFCPSCSWGLDKHTIVNFNGMPFAYCGMGDNPYMNAESFASYDMPISERQRYRIRKLGGRIDKAMNRSDASRYIKSLMLDIHGAESFAASDPKFGGVIAIDSMFDSENDECRVCQGFGYYFPPDNATLGQVCEHCVKGWMIEDSKDDKFKTGVKLGAGAAVGFTAVSLGFGIAAGVVGLIYQKVTGE